MKAQVKTKLFTEAQQDVDSDFDSLDLNQSYIPKYYECTGERSQHHTQIIGQGFTFSKAVYLGNSSEEILVTKKRSSSLQTLQQYSDFLIQDKKDGNSSNQKGSEVTADTQATKGNMLDKFDWMSLGEKPQEH